MSNRYIQESTENKDKPLILIVDDDQDILLMTSRILRKAGFEVIEGSSGEECLKLAREHKPELILLDVVLPDINGTEVCQRIKDNPILKDSFLILLSGQRTSSDEQADGLTCGADGYIARPIEQRELIARVELMLRLKRAQMETRAHAEKLTIERNKLTSLFDGISDIIFVVNPNTYELLYSNPTFKETIGYHNQVENCYSILQDSDKHSSFCTSHDIYSDSPNQNHIWECFNKEIRRWYRCIKRAIHWPDGNMVCLVQMSDITEQKDLENELRQSIKDKDFLMKEINHRVKNNLLMISSLMSLKDSIMGNQVDLSDIKSQIDAIRIVHEKLHQTDKIQYVDVSDYFYDLVSSIFSTFSSQPVELKIDVDPIQISTKKVVALGLLINEIATNAIKHGFKNTEVLRFTLKMNQDKNGHYILTLSNTGDPFPEDIELDNAETLGLRLISSLVNQIDGNIELQKTPNPVFTIDFPIEN